MPALARKERLDAQMTRTQKELFTRAAEIEGKTLGDFVVGAAQDAARRLVQTHEVMVLSERDRKKFIDALLDPPPPNKALKAAMKGQKRFLSK